MTAAICSLQKAAVMFLIKGFGGNVFELIKAINKLEGMLAEAWDHNETGQHYKYIDGLEAALNVLRNELHAQELIMEQFAMEAS